MASIYYITTQDGDIFEMDATLSVEVVDSGSLSSYRLEDGTSLSDHYTHNNEMVRFSGKISDIKSASVTSERYKSTAQYISGLKSLKASNKSFTVTWREDNREGGVSYQLSRCLFENISIKQSPDTGYAQAANKHSYNIDLTIKQVKFGSGIDVIVEPNDFILDKTSEKKSGSGATSEFDEGEEPVEPLANKLGALGGLYAESYKPREDPLQL